MVAEKFDGASGELDFAFAGGSNIGPGTGHMHDAVFYLASNDRFDAKWDFVEADKSNSAKRCSTPAQSKAGRFPAIREPVGRFMGGIRASPRSRGSRCE